MTILLSLFNTKLVVSQLKQITCETIYLDVDTKQEVFATIHISLQPDGVNLSNFIFQTKYLILQKF